MHIPLYLFNLPMYMSSPLRSGPLFRPCYTTFVIVICVLQFIGHNEDALKETLNRFYIINAHIKPGPEEGGGKFATREEKWEAMTYAASLSGYASGHNHHGFVFAINTIFAKKLLRKKIREFKMLKYNIL